MNVDIRPEKESDIEAIDEVLRRSFPDATEAKLVKALREGGFVRVSLVAEERGRVIGHILFSELAIVTSQGRTLGLSLAPLAVHPDFQRQGIGARLVEKGLATCREQGYPFAIVVGNRDYYPRFGFSADLARHLECAYKGPSFMALELRPGSVSSIEGRVEYAPPFAVSP